MNALDLFGAGWEWDVRQGIHEVRHDGWVVAQVSYTSHGWRVFRKPLEPIPESILEQLPEGAARLLRPKVTP